MPLPPSGGTVIIDTAVSLPAICRTNRPYGEQKTHGLIVDYWGVADDLEEAIGQTESARRLEELGQTEDVDYCSGLDALPVLPYYAERRLVLSSRRSTAQSTS